MSSPDTPVYIPTTVHTVSETGLVAAAVADIRATLPEWTPREGHVEVMLIEAMAVIAGQTVYAANQLPTVILEGVLTLHGLPRKPALPAYGQVLVSAAAGLPGPRTLPVGSRLRFDPGDGTTLDLLTLDPADIEPAVSLDTIVSVVADQAGSRPNGILAGTVVQLVDPAVWVESTVLSTGLSGGEEAETVEAYLARGAAFLRRQSSTLVLASHFTSAALDVPGVGRASTLDRWDPTSGNPVGSDPGHVTVVVADAQGAALSAPIKATTLAALQAGALAGLGIHLVNPTSVTVNITGQIIVAPGYTPSVVVAAVIADLQAWLNPATWPWGQKLENANQVIARASRVEGVAWVKVVSAVTTFTDPKTLPTPGTLAITQGTP